MINGKGVYFTEKEKWEEKRRNTCERKSSNLPPRIAPVNVNSDY